jgi:hypothetical protein
MKRKLALKRLTASDLTLFKWHFQKGGSKSNQKAINLNADVFVETLYPSLPDVAWERERESRFPVDLYIFGPGMAGADNLQRKILKSAAYKNWRLDGEFIENPLDDPERYNPLEPGDFVLFEFFGATYPDRVKALLISRASPVDASLHTALDKYLGPSKMLAVPPGDLEDLVRKAEPRPDHPAGQFIMDADIEDAALGGIQGIARLHAKRAGRPVSRTELEERKKNADITGRLGEELVSLYLEQKQAVGSILGFT